VATRLPLDVPKLAAEYKAGDTVTTLGERYGVAPATVWRRLVDAEVKTRPTGPKKAKRPREAEYGRRVWW